MQGIINYALVVTL